MQIMKTLVCYIIIVAMVSDVIFSRPHAAVESESGNDVQALLTDIDRRLIQSERLHARRRRRHVVTQNIAIMEFCIQNPHRCREEIDRLRRIHHLNNRMTVVLIEK